jgi:hypothetical protein
MAGEARRGGAARIRQLVFPGDGAAWIWNLATQHFPEATQIADLYHAREHPTRPGQKVSFLRPAAPGRITRYGPRGPSRRIHRIPGRGTA